MTTSHHPVCAEPRLHTVHVDALPAQPWRNGGGVTRELLAWPAPDRWLLRLSVADITRDGPFSAFPGVQRSFLVLSGDGVQLQHPGRAVDLRPGDPPHCFDGGQPPGCHLLGGATRDLNLMLQAPAQGRIWPAVQPWSLRPQDPLPHWRGLFCAEACRLITPSETLDLPALSLAWQATPVAGHDWRLAMPPPLPRAWWITLDALET